MLLRCQVRRVTSGHVARVEPVDLCVNRVFYIGSGDVKLYVGALVDVDTSTDPLTWKLVES